MQWNQVNLVLVLAVFTLFDPGLSHFFFATCEDETEEWRILDFDLADYGVDILSGLDHDE